MYLTELGGWGAHVLVGASVIHNHELHMWVGLLCNTEKTAKGCQSSRGTGRRPVSPKLNASPYLRIAKGRSFGRL